VLAAKNKVLEVHDSDDESSGGGSEVPIDMTTAFTVLNPIEVLSNVETLVDECIANLEGDWAQTMCYLLAALFHYLAFNNGVRPDSIAKPVDSNGSVATKLVSIEVGDGGTIEVRPDYTAVRLLYASKSHWEEYGSHWRPSTLGPERTKKMIGALERHFDQITARSSKQSWASKMVNPSAASGGKSECSTASTRTALSFA
jgi:hypothetical protein